MVDTIPVPVVPSDATMPAQPVAVLEDALGRAAAYARQSTAEASQRAYGADWQHFEVWCRRAAVQALPAAPETVAAYLAAHGGTLAMSTLARRLSGIVVAHRNAGHHLDRRHPAIRLVLAGLRRTHGTAPRRVAAATTDVVRAMASACDTTTLLGQRDRALVLVGFAAALRRSELVALRLEDVEERTQGIVLRIRRSKGDQEGHGEVVGVARTGTPMCPVAALRAWCAAANIVEGAVFRSVDRHGNVSAERLSDRAVALTIKKLAERVGLDAKSYAGHSLRSGLATAAAASGVEERDIARQTRHRSLVVLRGYIRDGDVFMSNASARVGL